MRLVSDLKNLIVPSGRRPLRILSGPFKGIVMDLSLQSQAQVYLGLFERETYPWINRLSRGISTAIDIGAAHGEYTIYFLLKTKATKVFSFEPDGGSAPLLRENLQINGVDNSRRLSLSTKFVGANDTGDEVRLDSLLGSIHVPCFVKMDVDGAEEQILAGAQRVNQLSEVRWLIETHSQVLERACEDTLKAAGFQTKIIRNLWWRTFVPELRPTEHNRWLVAWKREDLAL